VIKSRKNFYRQYYKKPRWNFLNIFDIIGPVMIGPSSSHTAGAVRLGNLARNILGEEPEKARIILYNSFADTGKGHGTDKALVAGLLGFLPDDEKIKVSFEYARKLGIEFELVDGGARSDLHPNTAEFYLEGNSKTTRVLGSSVGGGRVVIFSIDGFKTEFSGEYYTVITIHKDMPGMIAQVTTYLSKRKVNIAQMRVSREARGEKALMIIETDEALPERVKEELEKFEGIYKVMVIGVRME
jgi:L-serine dehydratase